MTNIRPPGWSIINQVGEYKTLSIPQSFAVRTLIDKPDLWNHQRGYICKRIEFGLSRLAVFLSYCTLNLEDYNFFTQNLKYNLAKYLRIQRHLFFWPIFKKKLNFHQKKTKITVS